MDSTVFVLITDEKYFAKAKRTIIDLRSIGQWTGDIVLIPVGFSLPHNFRDYYRIIEKSFSPIDKSLLLEKLNHRPFPDTIDQREIHKLNQWEKLHVFDPFFIRWKRVVFLDAGLRILDKVDYLLGLDYKNSFIAPDDGGNFIIPNPAKRFITQVSMSDPETLDRVLFDFGETILESNYFLNCIWIYDTQILDICSKQEMIDAMTEYPICKTNEMTIMNLFLHFKYCLWKPFPVYINQIGDKILFDWSERNHPSQRSTWREYCILKYPSTITFEDT
jgi:hypothetical protein